MAWPRSLRARLGLWHAGTLALVLTVYTISIVAFFRTTLMAHLDHQLQDHLEFVEHTIERSADGIRWKDGEPDGPNGNVGIVVRGAGGGPTWIHMPPKDDGPLRTLSGRRVIDGMPVVIEVTKSERPDRTVLWQLMLVVVGALPLAVAGAGIGGYVLARRALRPMRDMARMARDISAERLSARLPVDDVDDEIGSLAAVFNDTLARLERSFEQLRRFTADASHELRTPLTAIRTVGEVVLHEARDPAAYRDAIGSILEESQQLERLVDALLVLARADDGRAVAKPERVELTKLARDVIGDLGVLAEEKRQDLAVGASQPVIARADPLLVRQALSNLVDNAVKHSPPGATIRVLVDAGADGAFIDVVDDGPGIPAEHREHVFERFYRIDAGRSRDAGGVGLGLAIARWAVEASGGSISLLTEPRQGTTFRVRLPADGNVV